MTRSYATSATLISALAVTGAALGQAPPNVVASDSVGNTAMGSGAMVSNTSGYANTAAGAHAMQSNTTGNRNVAVGQSAMLDNTDGMFNTAVGDGALLHNTTGIYNTAFGYDTLNSTTTGIYNAACGALALENNTVGHDNAALGQVALWYNTTGNENTAAGAGAMKENTSGSNNTAAGFEALQANTTGLNNTAIGSGAMVDNVTGGENTALGVNALGTNQGGSNNIAVGFNAGYYVRGGRYNIAIGNVGTANDAGTIRIGTSSQQSAAYIAGITNAHVTGSALYISSTGQLGVLASSERYKTHVASMGSSSEKVRELRPVTFHLKTDPKAGVQYGLIAEEVAKVYPELVIRGDKGQIEGVRYEELTPMLLNEVQQQQRTIAAQGKQLHDMQQQLAELQEFRRSMQGRAANQ
jgi:Chaperone of endosialidase